MNTKITAKLLFTIGLMTLKNKEYFLRKLRDRWVYNNCLYQPPFWDLLLWYFMRFFAFVSSLILSLAVMLGFITLVVGESPASIFHEAMTIKFWTDHCGKVMVSLFLSITNMVLLCDLQGRSSNSWWSTELFFKGVVTISEVLFFKSGNVKTRLEKLNTCRPEEVCDLLEARLFELALYVIREEKDISDVLIPDGVTSAYCAKKIIEEAHGYVQSLDIPKLANRDGFSPSCFPRNVKHWYTRASKQVEKELAEHGSVVPVVS